MKILLVHNFYQQSGGERVAVEAQKKLMRERGHEVITYERESAEIQGYSLWQNVELLPNTVISRRTHSDVRALVATERPDIAHVHNVFPLISPAVYIALKNAGVPIVQTIHNYRMVCPNGLLYTRNEICERCKEGNTLHAIRWKCCRQSYVTSAVYALAVGLHRRLRTFQMIDRFIALNEFTAQKLVEGMVTSSDKISIIANFLPPPIPVPAISKSRDPYILYLGRLSPEKGILILIDALAQMSGLGLKIAGTGPQISRLRELMVDLRLHKVELLGRTVGRHKWRLLSHALATVIPSVWYENLPFTALESFAVATPVVASKLGGLPYVVDEGKTGLLFEPGDGEDLRRRLSWLVAHPNEAAAMGRRGRTILESRFSPEAHYRKLMQVYAEAMQ